MFTLRAENNRSDPTIFTEAVEGTTPIKPSEMYDYFGDRDRAGSEAVGRYQLNAQEIIQMFESQKLIEQQIEDNGGENNNLYKKQQHDNIHPLPIGRRIARHDLPQSRSDWRDLNTHEENQICAAYQVPRTLVISDTGMSQTSVSLTKETFTNSVNKWKKRLSLIYTEIYRVLYGNADAEFTLNSYTRDELEAMTENDIFEKIKEPRVEVILPIVPIDTMEGLTAKFALGILSWSAFVEQSKLLAGYPSDMSEESDPSYNSDRDKDPWHQAEKISLLRGTRGVGLNSLGLVADLIFGSVQKVQPKSENGKKVGTSSSSSPSSSSSSSDNSSSVEKKRKAETETATEKNDKKKSNEDAQKTKKKKKQITRDESDED